MIKHAAKDGRPAIWVATGEETKGWKLTPEEQARWARFLHQTWGAIAPDAEPLICDYDARGRPKPIKSDHKRRELIMEMVIDADRPQTFSGMTYEENRVLGHLWVSSDRATKKWLHETLNY